MNKAGSWSRWEPWNWQHYLAACLLVGCWWTAGVAPLAAQVPAPEPTSLAPPSDCPPAGDPRMYVRPMSEIPAKLPTDQGRLPTDCSTELFTSAEVISSLEVNRQFHWRPTNFFHQPLYFDDQPLERYGQSSHRLLQPAISGVHFFSNIAIVPYKMGFNGTHDCVTPLGYGRPGNRVPCVSERYPFTIKGALLQAGTVCAMVFGLP
jgi:hypothetical protein